MKNKFYLILSCFSVVGCTTNYIQPLSGEKAYIKVVAGNNIPLTFVSRIEYEGKRSGVKKFFDALDFRSKVKNECKNTEHIGTIGSPQIIQPGNLANAQPELNFSVSSGKEFKLWLAGSGVYQSCNIAFQFVPEENERYTVLYNWEYGGNHCYIRVNQEGGSVIPLAHISGPVKVNTFECMDE